MQKKTSSEEFTKEDISMINEKYKEWFTQEWNEQGGLITQAQAYRILGKTSTRIRQMINEGKLKAFAYENDSPLVSLAQVMQIYQREKETQELIKKAHEIAKEALEKTGKFPKKITLKMKNGEAINICIEDPNQDFGS